MPPDPDSKRSATQPHRGISPFPRRLRAAFLAWATRVEFWAFALFAVLMNFVALVPMGSSTPPPPPTAVSELAENATELPADTTEFTVDLPRLHLFPRLPELQQLQTVTMTVPQLPSNTFDVLARCENLRWLTFHGVLWSDAEANQAGRLQQLRHLGLSSLDLTSSDQGLAVVKKIAAADTLRSLSLAGSRLRSDELSTLADLPHLEQLDLSHSTVGGEATDVLKTLTGLQKLNIVGTKYSRSERRELMQQLPEVEFQPDQRFARAIEPRERQRAKNAYYVMMALAFPAFLLGFGYGINLKTQFAASRSTLLPGFTVPHMVIAGTLLLVVTLPNAAVIWWCHQFHPVGVVSLSWLVVLMFLWQSWRLNSVLTIPMLVIWFGLLFGLGTDVIGGFVGRWFFAPEATSVGLLLLAGDVIAMAFVAIRIANVHEEMPEYSMAIPSGGLRILTSRSVNRDVERLQGQRIARSPFTASLLDRYFAKMMNWMPGSKRYRRIHQYQIAHGLGALVTIPVMSLMAMGVLTMFPRENGFHSMAGVIPALFLPHFMVALVGGIWLQHWRWYPLELLRPTSRQDFVQGVFRSVGFDVCYGTFWIFLIQLVAFGMGTTIGERTPAQSLFFASALTISYVGVATATLLFVLTNGTYLRFVLMLTLAFVVFTPLGFVTAFVDQRYLLVALLTLVAASLTVTGFLWHRAKARWMQLEFA